MQIEDCYLYIYFSIFYFLNTRAWFQACISHVVLIEKHHSLSITITIFTLCFFLLLNFNAHKWLKVDWSLNLIQYASFLAASLN